MFKTIADSINHGFLDASTHSVIATDIAPSVTLTGVGHAKSCFPVAQFSQCAIGMAVSEIQQLRLQVWGDESIAVVNRELSAAWCQSSVSPIDWPLPASWDEFAGDYCCQDGWIRLHTNAVRHREAALKVLGNPTTKSAVAEAVSQWEGPALESAIVDNGGAAAFMMSREQWSHHEQGMAVAKEPVVLWENLTSDEKNLSSSLTNPERPLKGLRILDLTRVLAGPVCTRFLASLGAEVLRIDPPRWDEDSIALETTLGKRCAGLDLTQARDRSRFEKLLTGADVIVHGYRRNALESLGFGDSVRRKLNPNLIDVALNAYGWSGPWTNRRGFDSLVQMSAGIAQSGQAAFSADKPIPLPYQALDHVTGYLMAATVVRAVREKLHSGRTLAARLSLARQATLLHELSGSVADKATDTIASDTLASVGDSHFQMGVEPTPWGELKRLYLPYEIEGVRLEFDHAVNRLRTSEPVWH